VRTRPGDAQKRPRNVAEVPLHSLDRTARQRLKVSYPMLNRRPDIPLLDVIVKNSNSTDCMRSNTRPKVSSATLLPVALQRSSEAVPIQLMPDINKRILRPEARRLVLSVQLMLVADTLMQQQLAVARVSSKRQATVSADST
jgi:hypothetical protein